MSPAAAALGVQLASIGVSKHTEVMKLAHDGYSIVRVLAEIAKCDVRCRNCHARVTYARQGYTWRTAFIDRRAGLRPRPSPGWAE